MDDVYTKNVGNITITVKEAESCGESFVVSLNVKTSTVKNLLLTPSDAKDLHYALGWALEK